jgi:hypothetical protein
MTSDLPAHLQTLVESICELGCERVNEIITELESGNSVQQTTNLAFDERQKILSELKAIMAVYDREQA